jgi:hypothetical protein
MLTYQYQCARYLRKRCRGSSFPTMLPLAVFSCVSLRFFGLQTSQVVQYIDIKQRSTWVAATGRLGTRFTNFLRTCRPLFRDVAVSLESDSAYKVENTHVRQAVMRAVSRRAIVEFVSQLAF